MTTISVPLLNEDFGAGVGIQMNDGGGVGLCVPFNAVDFGEFADSVTFIMSLSAIGGAKLSSISAAASTDAFTSTAHGLSDGTLVHVHAAAPGTALPGGLTEGGVYYIKSAATNTFKLSATNGGTAIDITADGQASVFYDIPTTWKVGAKFQILVPHTAAGMFQKRRWADLSSYNVAGMVTEGVGFGSGGTTPSPADGGYGYIADQTAGGITSPVTVMRTIRDFGQGVRLALDLPASGATLPRCNLSINALAHVKGSR